MPNIHTMHALLHAAYLNFNYKIAILRKMNELGIQCDAEVIRAVEKHIQKARCVILRMVSYIKSFSHIFLRNLISFESYFCINLLYSAYKLK